jgi:spermidine synthase
MRALSASWLALAGAALVLEPASPALRPGHVLLEQQESAYQSLRVVEWQDQGVPTRWLQVNEGFDSFQSAWRPDTGLLGEGYYYDLFALPAWWARAEGPFSVLAIGLGAGTIQRVLAGAFPANAKLRFCGVEIDPVVVELGRRWFELDPDLGSVYAGWDGRAALRALRGPFDLIALDAYANQVEIPPHLASREFFLEARSALNPGGWLLANVGGFGFDDPVVRCVASTVADAFGAAVLVVRVPAARNYMLVAREGLAPVAPDHPDWNLPSSVAAELLAALRLPGAWRWFDAGEGPVATDDLNPLDSLQRSSLLEARQRLRGRIE